MVGKSTRSATGKTEGTCVVATVTNSMVRIICVETSICAVKFTIEVYRTNAPSAIFGLAVVAAPTPDFMHYSRT